MIVFADKQAKTYSSAAPFKGPAAILADFEQRDLALAAVGIDVLPLFPDAERKAIRFESRNQYDYAAIHIPDFMHPDAEPTLIELYITRVFLVVLGNHRVLQKLEAGLVSNLGEDQSPAQMLSLLFNHILSQNFELLESIDDEIEKLEERATLKNPEDHSATIISLRKQLLALKRYFEALYGVLEGLEENQNSLFSKGQLQLFRAHKNKAGRLLNTVLSLRDYLTQVREAYQNQLDISLNDTMRFFTVITSIFLPLTLVVGWYGMNLHMPELASKLTYPVIVIASLAYVVFSLILSKRKGWF